MDGPLASLLGQSYTNYNVFVSHFSLYFVVFLGFGAKYVRSVKAKAITVPMAADNPRHVRCFRLAL